MKHKLTNREIEARISRHLNKPHGPTDDKPAYRLDGLRVVLGSTGGLVAITNNGLEIPLDLSLAGLNRLHEMLIEQQRKKELPAFPAIAAHCLADWERYGPHGAGKFHKPTAADRIAAIPDL